MFLQRFIGLLKVSTSKISRFNIGDFNPHPIPLFLCAGSLPLLYNNMFSVEGGLSVLKVIKYFAQERWSLLL